MWYTYLNRDQPYLRSFRTNNLWLDQYNNKIRCPRVASFHISIMKRLSKNYSGVSLPRLAHTERDLAPCDGLPVGIHRDWHHQVLAQPSTERAW